MSISTIRSSAAAWVAAASRAEQLRLVCIEAQLFGVPDDAILSIVREEFERSRAVPEDVDLAQAVKARVTAFMDENRGSLFRRVVDLAEYERAQVHASAPGPVALPSPQPSKRKLAPWKTRHYGPQR